MVTCSLALLASLTTGCATPEEYDAARTEWLHDAVDCDTIYQGAVIPAQAVEPVVTGVDPGYTAHCEAAADRYWPDRQHLNQAVRDAGGVAFDTEVLPAHERRERVFYREIVAGLGLRTIAAAVLELRGEPVSCIYFGWTSRTRRRGREIAKLRAALPLLALGDAVHHPVATRRSPDLGLTRREREIVDYIVRGLTNIEIAALLGTAPATVKNQVAAILRKTGTANRTELAWRAVIDGAPPRSVEAEANRWRTSSSRTSDSAGAAPSSRR